MDDFTQLRKLLQQRLQQPELQQQQQQQKQRRFVDIKRAKEKGEWECPTCGRICRSIEMVCSVVDGGRRPFPVMVFRCRSSPDHSSKFTVPYDLMSAISSSRQQAGKGEEKE